jgi:hypothetical protein
MISVILTPEEQAASHRLQKKQLNDFSAISGVNSTSPVKSPWDRIFLALGASDSHRVYLNMGQCS